MRQIKAQVVTAKYLQEMMGEDYSSQNKIINEADVYSKIPIAFRAIRLRVNSLCTVPVEVLTLNDSVLKEYPFEDTLPLKRLIREGETSLLLRGELFIVRLLSESMQEIGLQIVNPLTMDIEQDRDGNLIFLRKVNGQIKQKWSQDEIVYIKEYNPHSDIRGLSPTRVFFEDAKTQFYLSQVTAKYFEHGAISPMIIGLPEKTSDPDRERAEGWFKEKARGIMKAFSAIAFRGEVKIQNLQSSMSEIPINDIDARSVKKACEAYDIPRGVLTADDDNYASASSYKKSFISDTIGARCNFFEEHLNPFLYEYNCKIKFNLQAMPEMQEDEVLRSGALMNLVNAGWSKEEAAAILGYTIPDLTGLPKKEVFVKYP